MSRRELDTVRDVKASLQGIFQRTQRLQEVCRYICRTVAPCNAPSDFSQTFLGMRSIMGRYDLFMCKQELETLLDDDEDMADMYLTRRAQAEERRHRFNDDRRQSAAEQGAPCPMLPCLAVVKQVDLME